MAPNTQKTYEAQLWVRDDENITFHAKISGGSHLKVNWSIQGETPCMSTHYEICIFPFRFDGILYYGCLENDFKCATKIDENYNALAMDTCQNSCWRHVKVDQNFTTGRPHLTSFHFRRFSLYLTFRKITSLLVNFIHYTQKEIV